MEKLIHKPDGQLVLDDPFRTAGTKLRYKTYSSEYVYGVVTEASAKMMFRESDRVWACWSDQARPTWVEMKRVEVVK